MSKRRKRKVDIEVREKPEGVTKNEKVQSPEKIKTVSGNNTTRKLIISSVIIAVVFFMIGSLAGHELTGQFFAAPALTEDSDMFIFISPPGCTNCDELEPMARDAANTLGISFVKTGFGQEIKSPGFVLVYDNVLTISGFDSEYILKNQICQLTKNDDICSQAEDLKPPEEQTPTMEVPKSDRPEVHAFVMSHCPYGLQFLKAYVPVIELLGDKADLEVNFVHYIMHGEDELNDNTRLYCIQKEQKGKLTDYLRCFVEEAGKSEECISKVGIDSSALETCMQEADREFEINKNFRESGQRFPPYNVDAALAQQYGVGGSPTFGINGQQVQVSRSPEAIKQAVCSAFNNPPEECSQTLSSSPESPGFGPVGSGGGSGGSAQCS